MRVRATGKHVRCPDLSLQTLSAIKNEARSTKQTDGGLTQPAGQHGRERQAALVLAVFTGLLLTATAWLHRPPGGECSG